MKHPFPCALAGLALAAGLAAAPALAEDGHDPAQQAAAAALPRFAARSDAFELVGVLDGKRLTLYLDHAADNTPVDDATLEVELGGRKLAVQRHGAGEFEAELAEAPGEGVIHVSARVAAAAGAESQQLAGELDIHGDAHADEAADGGAGWQRLVPWALGLLSALLAAALGLSRTGTGTGRGVQP
ncbi:MAG TPA: hypothetical protein PLB41_17155 [Rubrivivax sp.]|nr:hypothetical protein [Rubrivivax sp.]HPO17760.1 hypothetical protein [Rubrivivax sp.]